MSYILDALKRAEHERTSNPVDGSGGARTSDQGPALRPATLILAGATLFLAGIGAAALLFRPPAPADERTVRQTVSAILPTPVPVRPEPVVEREAAQPVAAEPTAGEALALDEYASFDDITPVFQGAGVAVGTPETASAGTAELAPNPGAAPTAPADVATLSAAPPRLDDMPSDFRARFPSIQFQVHVHDTEPAKRWIMVDGRRYAEGSVLSQGPRVVEILPDGVIFELSGQRVLCPLAR